MEYCNENIKDVYHELFDEALARYNEKQTRNDRIIDDYYEKICSGKQEKPFHEIILQIGNKDDMGAKTEDGQLAAKILDEYMQDFQRRNPTLRVFSAYLHMDVKYSMVLIVYGVYRVKKKRKMRTAYTNRKRKCVRCSSWLVEHRILRPDFIYVIFMRCNCKKSIILL